MSLPAISPPKGRLTEAEARVIGAAANRIANLRSLLASASGNGSLTVTAGTGTVALTMTREDLTATLSLLIEREAALLTQFDVELATPNP